MDEPFFQSRLALRIQFSNSEMSQIPFKACALISKRKNLNDEIVEIVVSLIVKS